MGRHECSNGHELRWFSGTECPDCGREADPDPGFIGEPEPHCLRAGCEVCG